MTLTQIAMANLQHRITKLCADYGMDASQIRSAGVGPTGYFDMKRNPDDGELVWHHWPEGFPVAALLTMYDDLNWMIGRS